MNKFVLLFLVFAACVAFIRADEEDGDDDATGVTTCEKGFSWCVHSQKCIKTWSERCVPPRKSARKHNFRGKRRKANRGKGKLGKSIGKWSDLEAKASGGKSGKSSKNSKAAPKKAAPKKAAPKKAAPKKAAPKKACLLYTSPSPRD
eukprot:TRINITY_DN415_c0_g1_i1.p1 TRINITY_DN415_c0_g1~~TRINITY_DN415_c0_g1_i1.p1  ORF type:complete len:147 (-),score=56.60 TRINITY_DN415_c0_g1_i1:40-480(-)